MTTMNFILQGRDQLSRVLDRAGDSATRMGRRLTIASINSSAAINRFQRDAANRLASVSTSANKSGEAFDALKRTALSLAPAIIPVAAAMAPLVASTAAAGVAVGVYAAALGPQISAMSEATDAEKKYTDAVEKSGKRSKEAVTAQVEHQRAMAKLPPATRTAAAALSVLKDEYKDWSDSLAKDTMAPFTKGLALVGGLLPKLTPLVRGTSAELDRMMTILAGGMQSPGVDRLIKQFTAFSTGALRRANDGIVHLMRTLDTGKVGGGLSEFMDYARANGPLVGDTLRNIGKALTNLLVAGSDVGVGMLQAVNAIAALIAAVPPGAITVLLQLAIAIKATRLAVLGLGAARGAIAAFGVQLVAMQTAAAAAPGRLAAVTAAIGAMSRGAKIALAGTGIGLLIIALMELSQMGKRAPADLDKMTTSLGKFAQTGKLSGEALKVSGKDFKEFDEALRGMARPDQLNQIQQGFTKLFGQDSTPVTRWKGVLDDIDKSLASMVKSGNADLAAAAFARYAQRAESTGMTTAELSKELGDYRSAMENAKFEQQLAADSMGLFGQQALSVQQKLDAQKRSTDGLRQSIIALNEVNRAALDGRAGMEAAIDAAAEGAKKHANALRMSAGELDLNSEKARSASAILNDLARKTEENVTSARDSGKSWEYAKGQYDRGRAALIRSADQMGLNRDQARRLADQILKTPNKTAYLKGDLKDIETKLAKAKKDLKSVPDSRKAQVRATIADLEAKARRARAEIAAIHGKTVTITANLVDSSLNRTRYSNGVAVRAKGGPIGFPGGGHVRGPGTGTSDSILTRLSDGEYVIRASSVSKYGPEFLKALNEGRLSMASAFGSGGGGGSMGDAGQEAGRGLAGGIGASIGMVETSARAMAAAVVTGVRAELEIASPSKKMKALAADTGKGMIIGLTGSKARIAAVARDLVKDIWAAWKGTSSTKDSRLVAMVNRDTKKLQTLASRRDALASKIAAAKKYAGELTASARSGAELGSLGLQPEEVSAGSIKGGLSAKLAQIRTFTTYINQLAKKGLHKGLLRQILNMGPDQGYAYASALLGADKATFAQINSLQTQIDKSATTLGRAGADAMYDSGKNAGKGFLRGLSDQQKAIEAQMLRIAKGMQRAIKKALGIKSPSRVMAELGRYSTEGLAVGLVQRLPVLDKALGTVTGRVAAARPVIGRPAAAGRVGSGQAPVVVHVHVHGHVIDRLGAARAMQEAFLELKRTKGGALLGLA